MSNIGTCKTYLAPLKTVLFIAVIMILMLFPFSTFAEDTVHNGTMEDPGTGTVSGKILDGVSVRLRPQGSYSAVAVHNDGESGQDRLHIYHIGGSSRFYLDAMSDTTYRMYMYTSFEKTEHKSSGNCLVDIVSSDSYKKEGGTVHVVSDTMLFAPSGFAIVIAEHIK